MSESRARRKSAAIFSVIFSKNQLARPLPLYLFFLSLTLRKTKLYT